MTLAIRFIPEGHYTTQELQEFAKEFRQYLNNDEVMDREGIAAFLKMSVWNVDRLVRIGALRCHYLGDSKRFLKVEVIEDIARAKKKK